MTTEHFNGLTEAEAERLAMLTEECAEVAKCCTKILRHGYESRNPKERESPTNREHLERELGDIWNIVFKMCDAGDVQELTILENSKDTKGPQYFHHQPK